MNEIALIEQKLFDAEDEYAAWLRAEEDKSPSPELNDGEPWICAVAEVLAVKTQPLRRHLAVVIDQLATAVTKIQQLEARLAKVETHGIRYRGVYQRAEEYRRGDMITFKGSLWACVVDSPPNEPLTGGMGWQLAAKAGRDASGRDRRGE